MANLDAAALAELRRLLPTPCPVCGGERHFAELSSGFGCCSVPVAAIDDKDGQDAAARHWLASYAPSVPGAIGKLLDSLPHLLTLAERAATLDPALLDRLEARYASAPPIPIHPGVDVNYASVPDAGPGFHVVGPGDIELHCFACGKALGVAYESPVDGTRTSTGVCADCSTGDWRPGDPDVLTLVAAVRGLASGEDTAML